MAPSTWFRTSWDVPHLQGCIPAPGLCPSSSAMSQLQCCTPAQLEPLPSPCAGRNQSTRLQPSCHGVPAPTSVCKLIKSHTLHMEGAVGSALAHEPRGEIFSCHIKVLCDCFLCLSWAHILLCAYILYDYSFLHRFWFHVFIMTQKLLSIHLIMTFQLVIIAFLF